ncbi:MAG: hypothetical protein H5T64_06770 [Chloroflexi bacterium]|nr:hypothetical protein [Chloroflexota bacterium]
MHSKALLPVVCQSALADFVTVASGFIRWRGFATIGRRIHPLAWLCLFSVMQYNGIARRTTGG